MSKTLLLADDSVVIQKLVALSFANEDIELVTVYNGDDAVERIRETCPDLVLADVVMPGKSGYEVCEAVKNDPATAHVPVLLLTGTFEAFDDARAAQVGSNGHITKPFEAQALVERVNALLAAPPQRVGVGVEPASAAADSAAPSTEAATDPGNVYDFFDDDIDASLETGEDALVFDGESDSVALPDPLEPTGDPLVGIGDPHGMSTDPLALDAEPSSDRTVAIMPDDLPAADPANPFAAAGAVEDQATVTASGLFGGAPELATPPPLESWPTADSVAVDAPVDQGATVLADDTFEPIAGPEANANPDPMATVLTDDLSFSTSGTGVAESASSNDLFADPGTSLDRGVVAEESSSTTDNDFEFGFTSLPATDIEPPADLDPLAASGSPPADPSLMEQAEFDPKGSSAFDVSSSDLGDPLVAGPLPIDPAAATAPDPSATPDLAFGAPLAPPEPDNSEPELEPEPARPASFWDTPAPALPVEPAWPVEEIVPELQPSDATPVPTPPLIEVREPAPTLPESAPASESLDIGASGVAADLSEVMQGRIHETLEKVAWEAFADLSDSIVRQVLERVEQIAWEVIPQMAETLVAEEIRKMKGEIDD